MTATLDRVIQIAEHCSGCTGLRDDSAVDQDLKIWGDDVDEFANALAQAFGKQVLQWPWQRFTDLNEPSLLTVLALFRQLLTWPFRGSFSYPSRLERLELGHIARAIEAGHWIEP